MFSLMERLRETKQMEPRPSRFSANRGCFVRSFNLLLDLSWKPWTDGICEEWFRAKLEVSLLREGSIKEWSESRIFSTFEFPSNVFFIAIQIVVQFQCVLLISKFVTCITEYYFFIYLALTYPNLSDEREVLDMTSWNSFNFYSELITQRW